MSISRRSLVLAAPAIIGASSAMALPFWVGQPQMILTGDLGNVGTRIYPFLSRTSSRIIGIDKKRGQQFDLSLAKEQWSSDLWSEGAVCIHLAAQAGAAGTWDEYRLNNFDATTNLFLSCVQRKVKRIVFASSTFAEPARYGSVYAPPDANFPINWYGASKLYGEQLGRSLSAAGLIEFKVVRIGYVPTQWDVFLALSGADEKLMWLRKIAVPDQKLRETFFDAVFKDDASYEIIDCIGS